VRVVVGILKKADKVLLAERPLAKPYGGYWEFPGGKVESHETSEMALKRELHEELGIDVQVATAWFEYDYCYSDKMVHLAVWLVEQYIGLPYAKENQQLRWVNLAEMSALKILAGNGKIIEKLHQG
jgi:8-oxo-dGTP diphosphatase